MSPSVPIPSRDELRAAKPRYAHPITTGKLRSRERLATVRPMLRGLVRVLGVVLAMGLTVAGLATCQSDTPVDMWIEKNPDAGSGFIPPEPEGGTSQEDAGGAAGDTGTAGTTGAAGTTGTAGAGGGGNGGATGGDGGTAGSAS